MKPLTLATILSICVSGASYSAPEYRGPRLSEGLQGICGVYEKWDQFWRCAQIDVIGPLLMYAFEHRPRSDYLRVKEVERQWSGFAENMTFAVEKKIKNDAEAIFEFRDFHRSLGNRIKQNIAIERLRNQINNLGFDQDLEAWKDRRSK